MKKIKKRSRREFLIVVVILIIIALFLLGGFLFNRTAFDKEVRECMQLSVFQSLCVANIAIERKDIGVCTQTFPRIGGSAGRSGCVISYVEETGDAEACDFLLNELMIPDCLLNAISSNPNPEICEEISEVFYKNDCYYDLAEKTKDPQYCSYINEDCQEDSRCTWLKNGCVMNAQNG